MIKPVLLRTTERALALVLALMFLLPLFLTALRNLSTSSKLSRWLDYHWIGHPHLTGATAPMPDVPVAWQSVFNGQLQKKLALKFNDNFAGREALIRYTSELWFRLFHDTTNASSDIAVGEHDVLFEKGYLGEYFFGRLNKSNVAPWMQDLRRLQDLCRSVGMGFVVLLTPGKPSIYPEDTPLAWRHLYDPKPRVHRLLDELFRENGIAVVDGIDLIAQEKLKGPPAPLFPKGGSHWNQRACFIVANAIGSRFAEQGKPLEPLELLSSTVTDVPEGDEDDLVQLMNLARPWRYPCEQVQIKPNRKPNAPPLTMAVIGDSFCWNLLRYFSESRQFSDIGFYFHYRLYKTRFSDGKSATVRTPATPVDFNREIFAADCLLLAVNEATILNGEYHFSAFIRDAAAHLPDPRAPRPPFRAD